MKKVTLFVSNLCTAGGTERVTSILANELVKKYYCSIITLFNDKKSFFEISKEVKIINVYSKRQRLRNIFISSIISMIKILKKTETQIIIIVGRNNNIMPLIAGYFSNVKIIFCEHSSIVANKVKEETFKEKIYREFFQFLIIKLSYRIVLLTKKEYLLYQQLYNIDKNKLLIIPNFYNDELVYDLRYYNKYSKQIITVGGLNYAKGYEHLINIAKLVFTKHPDWQWHIYGDGEQNYKIQIMNLIKQNNLENHVILKGNNSNIYDVYQDYSFFVMTSRYEGFGMVLLEAKAKKLPLISFDINSGPSDIIRDGIDGFLIKPFDCKAMADKICELIEQPKLRQYFSDNTHGNLDKFNKEEIIRKWCDLIDRI